MNKSFSVLVILFISTLLLPAGLALCRGPACASLKNQYTLPSCGDKKITAPETCDPPDALCKDADNWPGLCSTTCTCVPYKKPMCGNAKIEQGEQCEKNADCTSGICDNCTCPVPPPRTLVSILPPEQPLPITPVQEETPSSHEVFQPIGFNESIGIQVSYAVASFGHAFWNLIIDIFASSS